MQSAVSVRELTKSYGGRRVVDGWTFEVATGTVCALLGPNGAGKTTTLECLAGLRAPDRGQLRVLGLDPRRERLALADRLGVMLQDAGLYQAATPRQMLGLYARFYSRTLRPEAVLELVGLGAAADTRCRRLSAGQRQRLSLGLALIGRPRALLLDEPTAGMDPAMRRATWQLLRDLRGEGVAVLLTTHLLEEAERLADTAVIVADGRVRACGPPSALAAAQAGGRLLVTAAVALDPDELAAGLGAAVTGDGPGRFLVQAGPEAIPAVSEWFARRGLPLTGVRTADGTLEDVFLRLTDPGGERPGP